MIIREKIFIDAPPEVVWRVFAQLEKWDDWNPACRQCCILEGAEMSAGTCFSFVIRPFVFPLKVSPRIVSCQPLQEAVWEGGRFGLHATHRWRFRPSGTGTELLSVENFRGPLVWLGYLLGVPRRLHRLTVLFLESAKRASEGCANADH
jgi:hypothetical protein